MEDSWDNSFEEKLMQTSQKLAVLEENQRFNKDKYINLKSNE